MFKVMTAIGLSLALSGLAFGSALAGLYDQDFSSSSYGQSQQRQEQERVDRHNREQMDQYQRESQRRDEERQRQYQRDNEVRQYQFRDSSGRSSLCNSTSTYTSCN